MKPRDLGCPLKGMVPTVAHGSITMVLKPSLVKTSPSAHLTLTSQPPTAVGLAHGWFPPVPWRWS